MYFQSRGRLARRLAEILARPDVPAESIEAEFSSPPSLVLGHLAYPCFRVAKLLGQSAQQIAEWLAREASGNGISGAAQGPYANFRFDVRMLYERALAEIFSEGARYGGDASGRGKRIVLEYCSPNVAKKLAFQHIRSTLIGNTLANVYDYLGYETERICFVGDWGQQFARLLAAVELWGRKDSLDMGHLFELYVRFHREVEENPSLVDKATTALRDLEEGKPGITELWKRIREISVAATEKTLGRLHVRFDHLEGESRYVAAIANTLEEIKERAGARFSDGAWIVDVEGSTTPALVQKRDGTTLYLTRDLAAAIDRWRRFEFDRGYYVVSEQQKLHFELLFGVLAKMGHEWAARTEHLSFGTVLYGAEKTFARTGHVVFLDDVLDEAKRRALAVTADKNPEIPNQEAVAETVGIGAVIFGALSAPRARDIEFDWNQALALDGETGPYVQYACVRCVSILEKAGDPAPPGMVTAPPGYEFAAEEEGLCLELAKFRAVLHHVVRENEPYHLTHYLIDVAKAFSRFYYRLPVLQATEPAHRALRLHLVRATRQTLANGLELLGMASPKEM